MPVSRGAPGAYVNFIDESNLGEPVAQGPASDRELLDAVLPGFGFDEHVLLAPDLTDAERDVLRVILA